MSVKIEDYEWLEQVPARSLSSSSLVLVTKFTRHVRSLNGRILGLRDPLLFRNMMEEVIVTNDKTLASIFTDLMVDVKGVAVKAGLEVPKHLLNNSKAAQGSNLTYRGVAIE